jgi:hypothetical protein
LAEKGIQTRLWYHKNVYSFYWILYSFKVTRILIVDIIAMSMENECKNEYYGYHFDG